MGTGIQGASIRWLPTRNRLISLIPPQMRDGGSVGDRTTAPPGAGCGGRDEWPRGWDVWLYSYCRLSTGLAVAARIDCSETVSQATMRTTVPATRNGMSEISVWYVKEASHCRIR